MVLFFAKQIKIVYNTKIEGNKISTYYQVAKNLEILVRKKKLKKLKFSYIK